MFGIHARALLIYLVILGSRGPQQTDKLGVLSLLFLFMLCGQMNAQFFTKKFSKNNLATYKQNIIFAKSYNNL